MLDHAEPTIPKLDLDADALRQRVRDHVAMNSTSLKSVALLAGVGESTFTAWLGAKYRGDNDAITEKVRIWAANEETIARTKTIVPEALKFTHTSASKKILGALEHAQVLGGVVVITGGPGVGKTTSCNHYMATHPNVWKLTSEPLLSGPFAMVEYLRDVLGIPQTAPHKLSRAIAAKLTGTKGLLIFDEAQHQAMLTIDQIRAINDRCQIGIAFVGTEEFWQRIDGGGRKGEFAQFRSRVGLRVHVTKSGTKDADAILDAEEITDPKQRAMLKIFAGKPGALRSMCMTLRDARMMAAGAKEELTAEHIEAAWTMLSGAEVRP